MENASKALLMAAGVLISLLIISLGVYLFINFGQAAAETHEKVREKQLSEFNSQYTSYTGREDLTIYDVITVANMATQNNIYYEIKKTSIIDEKSYYISVNLKDFYGSATDIEKGYESRDLIDDSLNNDNEERIKKHVAAMIDNKLRKIICNKVLISEKTRRVYRLEFETK